MNRTLNNVSLPIVSLAIASTIAFFYRRAQRDKSELQSKNYESLIGETPLVHLKKLSSLLGEGKNIFVKMESMNPGGTGKDRAALFMLRDAEKRGLLPPPLSLSGADGRDLQQREIELSRNGNQCDHPADEDPILSTIHIALQKSKTGGIVVEGTSGSTGISLATLATQRGHSTIIVMPDDQSKEKQTILRCLGAVLHVVPTAAISNPNQYVNVARKIAEEINKIYGKDEKTFVKAAFMNQFENEANYNAHTTTTGPEIWRQTNHKVDAFCMSSGTGGTISGVGQYLKDRCRRRGRQCKIVLIDPPGSALLNKVKFNIAYASEQKERGLRRHRYDTIAEGIGLDRITHNFALGVDNNVLDDAIRVTDQESVDMAHWLIKEEGLFVGSSSAMNVFGAFKFAKESMRAGSCVVTVVCDGGQRHLTRFWSRDFIKGWGLEWPGDDFDKWISRLPASFSGNKGDAIPYLA
jgi:cysteine synthase A